MTDHGRDIDPGLDALGSWSAFLKHDVQPIPLLAFPAIINVSNMTETICYILS